MHRKPLILALVSFFSALHTFGQAPLTAVDIFEKASPAVLLIRTDKGSGTGFLVNGNGTIVTASHVIEGVTRVSVKTTSGEVFDEVVLLADDNKRDFAILKVSGFDLPTVTLGNSNQIKPGEPVTVIGNPLGAEQLKNSVSSGVVSGIRDLGEGYKVVQMTAAVSLGNSGGPAFNDKGEVIGLVAFGLVEGQSLNFVVPINYARGAIADLDFKKPITTFGSFKDSGGNREKPGRIPTRWVSDRRGWNSGISSSLSIRIEGDLLLFEFDRTDLQARINVRSDYGRLEKKGDVYVGTYTHSLYLYYPATLALADHCEVPTALELRFVSERRIELKGLYFANGLNDIDKKKCVPKKQPVAMTQTWIPE